MRNVWKGVVVGACTGAGIGLVLDLLAKGGEEGRKLSHEARGEAAHLVGAAAEQLRDAHLGERAKEAVDAAGERLRAADVAGKTREMSRTVSQQVEDSELVDRAREAVQRSG